MVDLIGYSQKSTFTVPVDLQDALVKHLMFRCIRQETVTLARQEVKISITTAGGEV